ncbi:MAG: PKD domain-containing protein [Chitinophagia bacterium]
MKKGIVSILLLLSTTGIFARHIAGGELFYTYIGAGSPTPTGKPTANYRVTLRLFRDCSSSGPQLESEQVTVGIYANGVLVKPLPLTLLPPVNRISLNTANFPCLSGQINVCYEVGVYVSDVNLEVNAEGYTLARLGCCRVDRISNLAVASNVGSNYVTRIPGTAALPVGTNSSPQFLVKDTALVCANKPFTLDFGAVDEDQDQLTYTFCDAFTSGSNSNNSQPPANLTPATLPYLSPYSGTNPLGGRVIINGATGIISGIAPPEGSYVVNVCIFESRNGKIISEHRKDFILKVQNCELIEADLPDKIIQCKDFLVHFENGSYASGITSYQWEMGDKAQSKFNTPTVDFTYADTGRYLARLNITGPRGCQGVDSTLVLVYPGFNPAFSVRGNCYNNPVFFTDKTTSRYGVVNFWKWNFGDDTTDSDTAITKNPNYTYAAPSNKSIRLVTGDSKGCIDSLEQIFTLADKPILQLPFRDTLICSIDTLRLSILNSGTFQWTPTTRMLNPNSDSPLVFPLKTTQYRVTLTDNGCTNTDSVLVRVLDFIKVYAGKDTLICAGDPVQLSLQTEALNFLWKTSSGEIIAPVKNPIVQPQKTTLYYVTANLGKCEDKDTIQVKTIPYPISNAGRDTIVCFGEKIQLKGKVTGSKYLWSPSGTLSNPAILQPIAVTYTSTYYVLSVSDTLGCKKTVSDTVLVTVALPVKAFAGNDTAILVNQPLQLSATGGTLYSWSPELGLSNPAIANPIALIQDPIDSIRYRVKISVPGGCSNTDDILVKIFNTGPDIFIPSAFTPNQDGLNDILKPFPVGIQQFLYFSVYNRWGQVMYTSKEINKGWDGKFGGLPQPSGTYVFSAEGIDYLGKRILKKGTTVLIR